MMPPCYGRYSAHRLAPCWACALRGPCASRISSPEGFAVLHHPRYAAPVTIERALAKTVADDALFVGRLKAAGMRFTGGWWRVRAHAVARLKACVPGRVEVAFSDLLRAAVASLPPAALADVFPTFDTVSKRGDRMTSPAAATRRRAEASGCVAVLQNPADAGELVVCVAKTCYSEGLP